MPPRAARKRPVPRIEPACGKVCADHTTDRRDRSHAGLVPGAGHISFCTACSNQLLTRVILVARVIPLVSFKVVSYGAGLTNMSVGSFAVATFFGMLPLTFLYVSAGHLIVGHGVVWAIVAGVIVVAGLLALPMAVERFDIFGLRSTLRHYKDAGVTKHELCQS